MQTPLPMQWIDRIFQRLTDYYGAKFLDQWRDHPDPDRMRNTWAERLGGFREYPDAIKAALESLDTRPYPPTLPEFVELCRNAAKRLQNSAPLLSYTPTAEDAAKAAEIAQKVRAATSGMGAGHDPLRWAKRPGSVLAAEEVIKLSKRDPRFVEIVADLKAAGVISESGHVLKIWNGNEFAAAGAR